MGSPTTHSNPNLILASTSVHRRKQLEEIGLFPFCIAPLADEASIADTAFSPREVAEKRAQLKARSVAAAHPDSIVIGADQLVELGGKVLGKPHYVENAVLQINAMSGKTHHLHTSMVLVFGAREITHTDTTSLKMHELAAEEIGAYVRMDQPLDCAGSYKIEDKGLWLFEKIDSADYTAIRGLPLLALINGLRKFGYSFLS